MKYYLTAVLVLVLFPAIGRSQCAISEQRIFTSPNTIFDVGATAFTNSGQLLAAGSAYQPSPRSALAIFDPANTSPSSLITLEDFYVRKIAAAANGTVLAGFTYTESIFKSIIVVRRDASGNMLWVKRLRGNSSATTGTLSSVGITDLIVTSDGGTVLTGTNIYSVGGSYQRIGYIIKLDAAGDVAWSKEYLYVSTDFYALTEKDGFLYAAGTAHLGGTNTYASLFKLDMATGDAIARKGYTLSGVRANYFRNLHATPYGFLAAMQGYSAAGTKNGYYVVKLDPDGNVITQKQLAFDGQAVFNNYYDVMPTSDGGCLAWQDDKDIVIYLKEAKLYKLDNQLQPQWKKNYPVQGPYSTAIIYTAWEEGGRYKALGLSVNPAEGTQTAFPRMFTIEADGSLGSCFSQDAVLDIKDSLQCTGFDLVPPTQVSLPFTAPLSITIKANGISYNTSLLCNTSCSLTGLTAMGDTLLCKNAFTELKVSRNGNCPVNMQWSADPAFAGITSVNDTTVRLNVLRTGYGVVAVKWQNTCGSVEKHITVYYNPLAAVPDLGKDTSFCTGDTLLLQLPQAYSSVTWSDQSSGSSLPVFRQGTYWVKVSQDNVCFATDTMQVNVVYPRPLVNIHKDSRVCLPDPLLLRPGSFSSYLWQDGTASSTYAVTAPGSYWVQVTDSHQCVAADTVEIRTVGYKPVDFLSFADSSICRGQRTVLTTSRQFSTYNWSDGTFSGPAYAVTQPGLYPVAVTDKDGCTGIDTVVLINKGCETTVVFPNAFAPHGSNKYFRAIFPGTVPDKFHLVLFNRWGQKIFETSDPYGGWDGRLGNHLQASSSFPWVCTFTFEGQPPQTQKGIVSLFR